jgi:2-polyprenyl-6-methoxyphenol hydroxylase and related FAD-dependent oxidoreductases
VINVVCVIRQKLSNNIDLIALIKKEIIPQNKNLKSLFDNKLEYWPIYTSKKPSRSIYENLFYIGDAFFTFPPTMAQGASQSIETANELFNFLSKGNKHTLDLFFKKRLVRTKVINRRSKLNYRIFHFSNPILKMIRNKSLKILLKNKTFLNNYIGKVYK